MKKIGILLILSTLVPFCLSLTSCSKDDENSLPSVTILKTEPTQITAGGVVMVSSAAADPDKDIITYTYRVSGGSVSGSGSIVFWRLPKVAGEHSITVTASDGEGGTDTDEKTVIASAPVTQISGVAELQNTGADLKDSKIFLFNVYPSVGTPMSHFQVSGAGNMVVFNLSGFNAGIYYILLWKDRDNNGSASAGDLVGWYGDGDYHAPNYYKIEVVEGQTFYCEQFKTYIAY